MNRMLFSLTMAVISLLLASSARASTYVIDTDHTSIMLKATHLGIGTVQGRFEKFSGSFRYDPNNIDASEVSVRIDASSIDTNQPARDSHLRSADFLNVKKYPEITFTSTRVTRFDRDRLEIRGDLSLHGVTRSVAMLATLGGALVDVDGKKRVAFHASMDIYRKDFGFHYNRVTGIGSKLVGEMIQVILDVEGVEQAPLAD